MQERMESEKEAALSSIESYQRTINRQKERLEKDLTQLANDESYQGLDRIMRERELKFNAKIYLAQQEGYIQQQQNIIAFLEKSAHFVEL